MGVVFERTCSATSPLVSPLLLRRVVCTPYASALNTYYACFTEKAVLIMCNLPRSTRLTHSHPRVPRIFATPSPPSFPSGCPPPSRVCFVSSENLRIRASESCPSTRCTGRSSWVPCPRPSSPTPCGCWRRVGPGRVGGRRSYRGRRRRPSTAGRVAGM